MKKVILLTSIVFLLAAGCNSQSKSSDDQSVMDEPQRQQIQVSQKVEGEFGDKLFNFYADENKTVLDLLQTSYPVVIGSSSTVTSIDGVKPDKKHFWQLFINGQAFSGDVETYYPKNGDKVEWKQSETK